MTRLKYPVKVQRALERKGFFNMTYEERIKKHREAIKKTNNLLSSEDKKMLVAIIEEEVRWPD